jgi:glycosyltransferase involved in cell wall biosynthesis
MPCKNENNINDGLVSVIIPVYNREKLLLRALDSVLNQTYSYFEVLIIDDASTDGTIKKIKKSYSSFINKKIIYIHQNDCNNGPSVCRNLGIKYSSGEYIAYLDSDDAWHSDKLLEQINIFKKNPDALYCHTDEEWFYLGKIRKSKKQHKKQGGLFFERALKLCLISPSSVLMRREFFSLVGKWNEELRTAEDYELWIRAQINYPAYYIPRPLTIKYGGHPNQLSSLHYNIDLFRLKALINIIKTEYLPPDKFRMIQKEIKLKLKLIIKGFEKRNKTFPQPLLNQIHYYSKIGNN